MNPAELASWTLMASFLTANATYFVGYHRGMVRFPHFQQHLRGGGHAALSAITGNCL